MSDNSPVVPLLFLLLVFLLLLTSCGHTNDSSGVVITSYEPPAPVEQNSTPPLQDVLQQVRTTYKGGIVPTYPVLASAIVDIRPSILGMARQISIEKKNPISVLLAEYQGICLIYCKLPILDNLKVGVIVLIVSSVLALKFLGKIGVIEKVLFGVFVLLSFFSLYVLVV